MKRAGHRSAKAVENTLRMRIKVPASVRAKFTYSPAGPLKQHAQKFPFIINDLGAAARNSKTLVLFGTV